MHACFHTHNAEQFKVMGKACKVTLQNLTYGAAFSSREPENCHCRMQGPFIAKRSRQGQKKTTANLFILSIWQQGLLWCVPLYETRIELQGIVLLKYFMQRPHHGLVKTAG